jgi:hypothetical protein
MSSASAEAFVAEELSLIQTPDAPTSREIFGIGRFAFRSRKNFGNREIWRSRSREKEPAIEIRRRGGIVPPKKDS